MEEFERSKLAYVLSLNGFCNNNCSGCLCTSKKRKPRRINDLIKEASAARPYFNGFIISDGEPTLLEDLPGLLTALKKLSPEILQVHTNARMMYYKDFADRLREIDGVDYIVKIFSHRQEVHDLLTRVDGSFEQTVLGIKNLSRIEAGGIGLHVEVPVMNQNLGDVPALIDFSVALGAQSVIVNGGHLAFGGDTLNDKNTTRLRERILSKPYGIPVTFAYTDNYGSSGEEIYKQQIPSKKSGLWLIGSDTNNPFIFRKCSNKKLRAEILNPPFRLYGNDIQPPLAPSSASVLKGFLNVLGYQATVHDLSKETKTRPGDIGISMMPCQNKPTKGTDIPDDLMSIFNNAIDICELKSNTVIWICSRYELLHDTDINTHAEIARNIARLVRENAPDPVLALEQIEQKADEKFDGTADYVFMPPSFSAYSIAGLLNMIEYGDRTPAAVYGITSTRRVPDRAFECDISLLPRPDFSDIVPESYKIPLSDDISNFLKNEKLHYENNCGVGIIPYYLSTGCRFGCAFCGHNSPFQTLDPVRAADDLASICEESNLKCVEFQDRAINIDESFTERFCDAVLENGAPFLWSAIARPGFYNPDLPKKMRAAGCVILTMAIESGSDAVLERMNKGFNSAQSEESLFLAASAGIVTKINVMTGFPFERSKDVDETIAFLERNKDKIDFVDRHTSFTWHDARWADPNRLNITLRDERGTNCIGNFRAYDEVGWRSWENILTFKRESFMKVEGFLLDNFCLGGRKHDAEVFWIFSSGYRRNVVRHYISHLKSERLKYFYKSCAGGKNGAVSA
ncbi:MAG: radical SAM protein, partial [Ignavibacteriae bacterium]|nr:radical SAM protein [Ignavibacteriota bacterium]